MKSKSIKTFIFIFVSLSFIILIRDVFYAGYKLGLRDHPKSIGEIIDDLPSILFISVIVAFIFYIWDPFTKWDKLDEESAEKLHLKSEEMTNLRNNVSEFINCLSCGYQPTFFPWGVDGQSPSMEICPCCGVQFGNEDKTLESLKAYRSKWISKGAKWFSKEDKPEGWDMEAQMKNIPEEFL